VLVDPVLVDPVLVDPLSALPEAVSVGLVLAPPAGPCELDAGGAGVEELLPAVVDDAVALGLAFLDGVAVSVRQGVAVAFADVLPFLALLLAFAEAVEAAVLVALADPVPVGGRRGRRGRGVAGTGAAADRAVARSAVRGAAGLAASRAARRGSRSVSPT